MPEDEKSKLFLTIFRDLSVTSKSALLLDLLQECKDLKAAGQVTNSPVTDLMRDNRAVEQSDIDMRYESNKKNIVQERTSLAEPGKSEIKADIVSNEPEQQDELRVTIQENEN